MRNKGNVRGPPRIDPADPFRFVRDYNGTPEPLFLAGYYPGLQSLLVPPGKKGWYVELIDQLHDSKVNLLRVCLTFGMVTDHEWRAPYKPAENAREPSTLDKRVDLDKFNEEFFGYWKGIFDYAKDRDVILQACLFDGVHTNNACTKNGTKCESCDTPKGASVWAPFEYYGLDFDYYFYPNSKQGLKKDEYNNKPEAWYTHSRIRTFQENYINKAVSTLGESPNLIWEVINEPPNNAISDPRGKGSWMQFAVDAIRKAEQDNGFAPHLIMPADLPSHQQVAGHEVPIGQIIKVKETQKCSKNGKNFTIQAYKDFHKNLTANRKHYELEQFKAPLISDNDRSVCPGPLDKLALWQRRKAWTALVGGGYASLFVFNVTTGDVIPGGLHNPAIVDGMQYVGLTRTFVEDFAIDLVATTPRVEPLEGDGGPAWSLDHQVDGTSQPYVGYFIQSGSARIDGISDPSDCEWFDPRSGDRAPATPVDGVFTTPPSVPEDGGDWVLYLPSSAWGG